MAERSCASAFMLERDDDTFVFVSVAPFFLDNASHRRFRFIVPFEFLLRILFKLSVSLESCGVKVKCVFAFKSVIIFELEYLKYVYFLQLSRQKIVTKTFKCLTSFYFRPRVIYLISCLLIQVQKHYYN